jgi:hypothetical protein
MDLQPAQRSPDVAPTWNGSKSVRHHAALLHGATVTGEAARNHLSVRVGLWLDETGRVRQARWRSADEAAMREYAEAACSLLEARADPLLLDGDALRKAVGTPPAAGQGEYADLVAAAVHAALPQGGATDSV